MHMYTFTKKNCLSGKKSGGRRNMTRHSLHYHRPGYVQVVVQLEQFDSTVQVNAAGPCSTVLKVTT